jgi:phosphonate degradation associated HDIG domain protein
MSIADTIVHLFSTRGDAAYFGEPVSQSEHALQCAWLAIQEQASDALIIAALLHDVGHLIHGAGEDIADRGIDAQHEAVGDRWLRVHFGQEVTEPARLHVEAKRYLCTTADQYFEALSPASQESFLLQGGRMSAQEVELFERNPYYCEALCLRHWDDAAKIPGLHVPGVESYRARIESLTPSRSLELAL